jgi:hypothetical protein
MANLLLQRRKRVESGTGTSVPEIRVVGSNLKASMALHTYNLE